ncbi:MFS transporter [Pseudosulfitobacter koreensis]|uniref:MFS transporter n=1 Tax=Pseudosulfitobacter koreensis TaxID=2968472 RepID=A0ABT1Z4B3_9RHOB|nr:MFS transporter [Pseudosulfitobacter koreense]MCR8827974.1 MFS transporter [Pseudosulfitobacter koreense]
MLIPVLTLSNFLIGVGAFIIIGMLEPLGADLSVTPAQAGQLLTVYAMSYAVLSPMLVAMTGRIGRRRVMALGLSMFALAALLSALAPSMLMLDAARVLAAAGAGLFTPVAAATAAALYPPEQRARVLAMVFFGFSVAQVLGVPAGSYIAYTFGWRWGFWSVVALALPCISLIWIYVPVGLKFQPVTLGDLRSTLGNFRMMFAVLFTSTFLGATYILFTYMAPVLSETMGYGRDGVTLVLAVTGVGAVIGNLASGLLTDRLGWLRTLVALCLCQIVLLPMFSLLPMADAALMVLTVLWSMTGWAFMAAQQSRLVGLAGAQATVVLALNAAAIYVGAAIGSAIGGWVLARAGVTALGIASGCGVAVALAHLLLSARMSPKHASAT